MRLTAAIALAATVLIAAPRADAYSFAPSGQAFVGAGKVGFAAGVIGLDCKTVFSGAIDAGGGVLITAVTLSGGALGACGGIHALGLPWPVRPTGPRAANIALVHVNAPMVGDCQGLDVPLAIDEEGVIRFGRFALSAGCAITGGALATRPPVAIRAR
jgi:hypothetical protein